MVEENHDSTWRIVGKSVRGSAHKRTGLPNQDSISHWPLEGEAALPLVLAVSDGHGSAKYFRSDKGARFAVDTAIEVIRVFLAGQTASQNPSFVKRTAEERLPQELVRKWRATVDSDIGETPFSLKELDTLEKREGAGARQAVEGSPVVAYGATLLAVVVDENFLLFLQLGDGDILTVSENGQVVRPVPGTELLIGNETKSLCLPNAWRDIRVSFQPLFGPPALILLCTDGYANSFVDDSAFLKVGPDILEMIRSEGLDEVSANVETWLTQASEYSGDDITLGIICRMDALGKPADDLANGPSFDVATEGLVGESLPLSNLPSEPLDKSTES